MNNTNQKILVTGGEGMVGSYFADLHDVVVMGRDEFDVTNPKQMKKVLKDSNFKAIVHLAAMTDVDFAQDNPDQAFEVNSLGTYNVAKLAQEFDIHMVYVSTGAVFYGNAKNPYTTASVPNPRSVYAKSKRIGEEFVASTCDKYSIVRTGWVFGGMQKDKKFVAAITRQIWSGRKELMAIDDAYGCPTYAKDLVSAILEIVDKEEYGVFHAVNDGFASRYQIAREIVKVLGERVKVSHAKTSDFPAFNAPRPRFEVIEQNLPLRSWKKALKEYLVDWSAQFEVRSEKSETRSFGRVALAK